MEFNAAGIQISQYISVFCVKCFMQGKTTYTIPYACCFTPLFKGWTYAVFIVLLMLYNFTALGNHVIGGDLRYEHISGNTYKIILTIYGDCSSGGPFYQLDTARPQIKLYANDTFDSNVELTLTAGKGTDVSPVCPAQLNFTTCNNGILPGVYKFVYEKTIVLPYPSQRWKFVFAGILSRVMGPAIAGRALRISNLNEPDDTSLQLTATLDNTTGGNTTPAFRSEATPYYCINQRQTYNLGAIDTDGDSLVYSLQPAINGKNGTVVAYRPPYNALTPLNTSGGSFQFNTINGQISFMPDIAQYALVVVRLAEYRAGRLVGTTQREMTFIVRSDCTGESPSPIVNGLTNATITTDNIINICEGEPNLAFKITMHNPTLDTIALTATGVPATASVVITNNNTLAPEAQFTWPLIGVPTGNYTFYLNIKNNQCPIINNQTIAFTIRIVRQPQITVTQITQTHCVRKASVMYTLQHGYLPRTLKLFKDSVLVKSFTDTIGPEDSRTITDSLSPGNYTLELSSNLRCVATTGFTIKDSGALEVLPYQYALCKGDDPFVVYVPPVVTGATKRWYTIDGKEIPTAPVVYTSQADTFRWYFVEQYKVCVSPNVPATVVVNSVPDARITSLFKEVCYGDKVYLEATGGIAYKWLPSQIIKNDTGGTYLNVVEPVKVTVEVTAANGCVDSTFENFNTVLQCCNFAYPNAFTPNNDGRNDSWRVVSYGNMRSFNLVVYNRWGQRVFSTGDANTRWDGTFDGQPCEMGTYYYLLNAQCLTGPTNTYKGEITLIR